ncbi:glycosyltransferase [Pseudomonas sp. QL9]|uniref:glycosyltransferase n=1 Tax=Pseudomonas sp. QL9 TaxID=3242725 RepID=UPI00352A8B96
MKAPLVTVAVPSFNQGKYLEAALSSIFENKIEIEVFVADAASSDSSVDIIKAWAPRLAGWRSHPDDGQAAAINESIAKGSAPYVCWLNSDDLFVPSGLDKLAKVLDSTPTAPFAYAKAWNLKDSDQSRTPVWTQEFSERNLALRCIISQPATLIRRSAWDAVGGLNASLHMAMDYDLWWRLYKHGGHPKYLDDFAAINREHHETKTNTKRAAHYREAMAVVAEHYGTVPLKWWIYQPYSVWFKTIKNILESRT